MSLISGNIFEDKIQPIIEENRNIFGEISNKLIVRYMIHLRSLFYKLPFVIIDFKIKVL